MTVSPGEDSAQDRAAVILTPDQRVRVFISSTLEELAEERAAALRAIRRLHLVPVWFESGALPHPHRACRPSWSRGRFSSAFIGGVTRSVGPGSSISALENKFYSPLRRPDAALLWSTRPEQNQE